MANARNHTLYKKAVQVTEEYLGPAGERFIRRQIETHLNIKPESLQKKNLPKLISWAGIAFAVITNNAEEINSFKNDLKSLTDSGS